VFPAPEFFDGQSHKTAPGLVATAYCSVPSRAFRVLLYLGRIAGKAHSGLLPAGIWCKISDSRGLTTEQIRKAYMPPA
jgi:hypothetical protein